VPIEHHPLGPVRRDQRDLQVAHIGVVDVEPQVQVLDRPRVRHRQRAALRALRADRGDGQRLGETARHRQPVVGDLLEAQVDVVHAVGLPAPAGGHRRVVVEVGEARHADVVGAPRGHEEVQVRVPTVELVVVDQLDAVGVEQPEVRVKRRGGPEIGRGDIGGDQPALGQRDLVEVHIQPGREPVAERHRAEPRAARAVEGHRRRQHERVVGLERAADADHLEVVGLVLAAGAVAVEQVPVQVLELRSPRGARKERDAVLPKRQTLLRHPRQIQRNIHDPRLTRPHRDAVHRDQRAVVVGRAVQPIRPGEGEQRRRRVEGGAVDVLVEGDGDRVDRQARVRVDPGRDRAGDIADRDRPVRADDLQRPLDIDPAAGNHPPLERRQDVRAVDQRLTDLHRRGVGAEGLEQAHDARDIGARERGPVDIPVGAPVECRVDHLTRRLNKKTLGAEVAKAGQRVAVRTRRDRDEPRDVVRRRVRREVRVVVVPVVARRRDKGRARRDEVLDRGPLAEQAVGVVVQVERGRERAVAVVARHDVVAVGADHHRQVVVRPDDRRRAEPAELVGDLDRHDRHIPVHARHADAVVARRPQRPRHRRPVPDEVVRVVVQLPEVPPVDVVDEAVPVVVDPVARDLAGVRPDVRHQVRVLQVHPRVDHRDQHIVRPDRHIPRPRDRRVRPDHAHPAAGDVLTRVVQLPLIAEERIVRQPGRLVPHIRLHRQHAVHARHRPRDTQLTRRVL